MTNNILLPQWLDNLIFNELNAKYCPSFSTMTNIDDDKEKTLNYLGTYFPRSYAESYTIFTDYFQKHKSDYKGKTELNVFDFGCGTGGEIIGLLTVIEKYLPDVQSVEIVGFDGNNYAVRLCENIIQNFGRNSRLRVVRSISPIVIDDFYDLSVLDSVYTQKFDFIITFKAICEFVSKKQFENNNPYENIARTFLKKIKSDGIMAIVDITVYNDISGQWLTRIMDDGLENLSCHVLGRNQNYNQKIYVTHSHSANDVSKIAWRIINNR